MRIVHSPLHLEQIEAFEVSSVYVQMLNKLLLEESSYCSGFLWSVDDLDPPTTSPLLPSVHYGLDWIGQTIIYLPQTLSAVLPAWSGLITLFVYVVCSCTGSVMNERWLLCWDRSPTYIAGLLCAHIYLPMIMELYVGTPISLSLTEVLPALLFHLLCLPFLSHRLVDPSSHCRCTSTIYTFLIVFCMLSCMFFVLIPGETKTRQGTVFVVSFSIMTLFYCRRAVVVVVVVGVFMYSTTVRTFRNRWRRRRWRR